MSSVFVRARKLVDGSVTYRVVHKVRVNGEWRDRTLASGIESKREAERIRASAERAARESGAGIITTTPTVADLVVAYLVHIGSQPGHDNAERYARIHVLPRLGNIEIGNLKRGDVQALIDAKTDEGLAPQSVRHVLSVLRAAINHALRRSKWDGSNVATLVDLPRVARRVKEQLEPAEVPFVLQNVREKDRLFFATAVYTGLRPGELIALKWRNVDLERRIILVCASHQRDIPKDGDDRIVPIAQGIADELAKAYAARTSDFVFPGPDGGMRPNSSDEHLSRKLRTAMSDAVANGGPTSLCLGWRGACRFCLGREVVPERTERCTTCGKRWTHIRPLARPVRFYDLRGTAGTLMVDAGMDAKIVSEILGHYDTEFSMRTYVRLRPESLRAGIDKMPVNLGNPASLGAADTLGAPVAPETQTPPEGREVNDDVLDV